MEKTEITTRSHESSARQIMRRMYDQGEITKERVGKPLTWRIAQ